MSTHSFPAARTTAAAAASASPSAVAAGLLRPLLSTLLLLLLLLLSPWVSRRREKMMLLLLLVLLHRQQQGEEDEHEHGYGLLERMRWREWQEESTEERTSVMPSCLTLKRVENTWNAIRIEAFEISCTNGARDKYPTDCSPGHRVRPRGTKASNNKQKRQRGGRRFKKEMKRNRGSNRREIKERINHLPHRSIPNQKATEATGDGAETAARRAGIGIRRIC